jgi:hypothetical protein
MISTGLIVALAAGMAGCAPPQGPFGGVMRTVRLADGLAVGYVHYEDENALVGSLLADGRVVALTAGGNLQARDARTLARVAGRRCESPGVLLAEGPAGEMLLGCQDGTVWQVEPRTLSLTERYHLEGPPLWIGSDGKALYAAMPAKRADVRHAIRIGDAIDPHRQIGSIRNLTAGGEVPFAGHLAEAFTKARAEKDPNYEFCGMATGAPSAWAVDANGRLWMGKDNGEWGGFWHSLDLATGRPGPMRHNSEGVYGFLRLAGGQMWAYGGMSHMGPEEAFIARLDGPQARRVYDSGRDERDERSTAPSGRHARPRSPITHMVEAKSGRLIVFSYGDVFSVDRDLKDWRPLGRLALTYEPGRPDAMSNYPAVQAVHLVNGSQDDIVCSTAYNGVVRVPKEVGGGEKGDEGGAAGLIGERFSFADVDHIRPSPGGTLLGSRNTGRFTHYWTVPESGPVRKFGLMPDVDPGKDMAWLRSHLVCADANSQVWAYDIGCWPGRMCLVRWTGSRQEVLAVEDGSFSIESIFATGDGRFWMCGLDRKLKLLRDNHWQDCADLPEERLFSVTALPAGPSRWLLIAGDTVLSMDCPPGEGVRVVTVELNPPDGGMFWIDDAAAMPGGRVLLATRVGLCLYGPGAGQRQWQPFPTIPGRIESVFRDDAGRMWLGGEGLWMMDRDGRAHDLSGVGLLAGATVAAIGPAGGAGGVLASLGRRGLLFIRPERR